MNRLRAHLPELTLVLAVGVLFHNLLLGEVIFWGTPSLQFYPWRELAFSELRQGRLPLWNALVGNGAPLLANYQTAVFYPPNWLNLLLSLQKVRRRLSTIQEFDPVGVAARDLKECLLIQTKFLGNEGLTLGKIVKNHL